jgi:dTDP-4-dehydrorhamnose 3,5-epimerase
MTVSTMIASTMTVTTTSIPGLLLFEPKVFADDRGYFLETYSEKSMAEAGIHEKFVQDNHSFSTRNVLRGLHYQVRHAQGKLVRVAAGKILDVAVDLRRSSPTFGKWDANLLSGENNRIFWIPPGFAHGFSVLSDCVHVLYKTTDFYFPKDERTIAWNDPTLNINWQLNGEPVISPKDHLGKLLEHAEVFA